MNRLKISAGILFLHLTFGSFAQAVDPVSVREISMQENLSGLGFGFWCNHTLNREAFYDFGRRPYERHGFYS